MASGDTLFFLDAESFRPPGTGTMPQLVERNGHLVLAFDTAADETVDKQLVMPRQYSGGGVTFQIEWITATVNGGTNGVTWATQFERHQDDTDDLDADSFAAAQVGNDDPASATGEPQYTEITHTDGAQMDSVAAGEGFRLRLFRDVSDAGDDLAEDAQLVSLECRET